MLLFINKLYISTIIIVTLIGCDPNNEINLSSKQLGPSTELANKWVLKEGKIYNNNQLYDGIYKEYYLNRTLKKKVLIANGLKQDTSTSYFFTGEIKEKKHYKNNLEDGKQEGYYPTGNLSFEYYSLNGKIQGDYFEYYANGKEHVYKLYKNGLLVSGSIKDIDGSFFSYYEIVDNKKVELYGPTNCNIRN